MRGERLEIPLVIGGKDVRTGDDARGGRCRTPRLTCSPTSTRAAPAEVAAGDRRRRRGLGGLEPLAVGGARRRLPPRRRAARRPVARHAARGDDARPVEDRAPGRDRRRRELIDFLRFNVEFMTRIYEEQPISSQGVWNRMEYRPLEGFVFAVTPVQLHGDRRQPAELLRADGQHRRLEARVDRDALGVLGDAALPGGRAAADGVINLVYGSGAQIGDAALASRAPRRRPLHRLDRRSSTTMWKTIGENDRPLPQLPADRRRDRRQGLHRRAPVRRRRRARDGDRPRLVRVPGPEVLGRVARLRALEPLAGAARAAAGAGRRASRWATSPTSANFMGAVIDGGSFATQRDAIEEARAHAEQRRRRRRRHRRQRGLVRRADRDRDARPGLPPAARRALRPRRHDLRLRRGALGRARSTSSTRPRRTG